MQYRFEAGSAQDFVQDTSWFRDAEGRYALLRGVNFGARSKSPPYLPILPIAIKELNNESIELFHQELEAARPELDYLKQLGFNIVRLLVLWKAIEPRPNLDLQQLLPEGVQYLTLIREIIDALYARGLFVIIDFHQDVAHEVYSGDGFPDWALAIDQDHSCPPLPDEPNPQWEVNYSDLLLGKYHTLVRYTLESFWRNNLINTDAGLDNFPVRTHLEKTIGQTARFFKQLNDGRGHPAILGYEPFNEPHQVGINEEEFETQILPEYYANVLREIRGAGDSTSFLFVEPNVDWTYYNIDTPDVELLNFTRTPESLLNVTNIAQDRAVFTFHYYDPWTFLYDLSFKLPDNMHNKQREWPDIFRRMRTGATSRGLIPFMTEFGASQDWHFRFDTDLRPAIYQHQQVRAYMDLQFQQIEAELLNATYWNYDLYNSAEGKDNWNLENFSLLGPDRSPRTTDIVARPYPMRSSAEPDLLFFDLETKHCAIMLRGPVVDAPTVIFVPQAMHYPAGFDVRATSADLQWDQANQLLYWLPDKNQALNQLIISPPQAFTGAALPQASQDLLPATTSQWRVQATQ